MADPAARIYGPDGRWAELFRTGDGYVETTLDRTGEGERRLT